MPQLSEAKSQAIIDDVAAKQQYQQVGGKGKVSPVENRIGETSEANGRPSSVME